MFKSEIRYSKILKILIGLSLLLIISSVAGFYVLYTFFDFTSSNAVIYFVKGSDGKIKITRDLDFDMADQLILMIDITFLVSTFLQVTSHATGEPVLDVTWDERLGMGEVKEFKPDGSIFSVAFSRFREDDGKTQGLFIGGDLPYGDYNRDKQRRNSGMGYYKNDTWYHLWCAANEGFVLKPDGHKFLSKDWSYIDSKIIKRTNSEVMIESRHRLPLRETNLYMKRRLYLKSGWDYIILDITFANFGDDPVIFTYGYGDEPWVGMFSDSRGDIGWSEGRLFQYEAFVEPEPLGYAGYWDHGNDAIHEGGDFTGVANFIQWLSIPPTEIYFANDFKSVNTSRPLDSIDNRIINLVWLNQNLRPHETKTYSLAIGMAEVSSEGFPVKPKVE